MAYLYDYTGKPWKTQEMVHHICKTCTLINVMVYAGMRLRTNVILVCYERYGILPGNAWFTCICNGTPLFREYRSILKTEKTFIIEAEDLTGIIFYIQKAKLNGLAYTKCYITHSDILNGGELTFFMGPVPNNNWVVSRGISLFFHPE